MCFNITFYVFWGRARKDIDHTLTVLRAAQNAYTRFPAIKQSHKPSTFLITDQQSLCITS